MRQEKYDIFISYCRKDAGQWAKEEVVDLLQCFRKPDGYAPRVFFDVEGLTSGEPFAERIAETIAECSHFLPIYSRNFFFSEWCMFEMRQAHQHDPSGNLRFIVPLLLHTEAIDTIPLIYRPIYTESALSVNWRERLCRALELVPDSTGEEAADSLRVWVQPVSYEASKTREIVRLPRRNRGLFFSPGSYIRIGILASVDCYINIVDVGAGGTVTLLFPAKPDEDNRCRSGETIWFPSIHHDFDFEVGEQTGLEKILVYASRTPRALDLSSLITGGIFREGGKISSKVPGEKDGHQLKHGSQEPWIVGECSFHIGWEK